MNIACVHPELERALSAGDPPWARLFFPRHAAPAASDPGRPPLSICLARARKLQRIVRSFRPGFVFGPGARPSPSARVDCREYRVRQGLRCRRPGTSPD